MKHILSIALLWCSINNGLAQTAFYKEFKNGEFYLYGINESVAPMTIKVNLDSLDIHVNKLILNRYDTTLLFRIDRGVWNDSTNLTPWLSASYNFGDPNAKADKTLYQLPFAKGGRYECIQGFNGKFSHRSIASKYALDFKMPVGSPIHAARDGIVIYTKEDSDEGGRDRDKYINKTNKIMILQSDGTIANYVHLKHKGVEVEIGDEVVTGQLIGYSGNTGFTTTPHLHFVVRVTDQAVKIKFEENKKIKSGHYYTH